MTKELLPGLLAVEVPEGFDFKVSLFADHMRFTEKGIGSLAKIEYADFPPGTWSILGIGTADTISEQEWAGQHLNRKKPPNQKKK